MENQETKLYKAVLIGYPWFFIHGIDEAKQMIHKIMIFNSKAGAQAWMDDQKSQGKNFKSTKVSLLAKKDVLRISGNSVVLKVKGGAGEGWKMVEESFDVFYENKDTTLGYRWGRSELTGETKNWYQN